VGERDQERCTGQDPAERPVRHRHIEGMKSLRVQCVATTSRGERCKKWAVRGATVCRSHGAATSHIRAKAAVRAEVLDWGLGDTKVDPGEVLLRLVSQSAARVQLYSRLLEEAYQAAERLAQERVAEELGDAAIAAGVRGTGACDRRPGAHLQCRRRGGSHRPDLGRSEGRRRVCHR
jgi:hypothetical protein